MKSNGAVYSDLDGDGDLDLVVNNYGSAPVIYRNRNRSRNHYLRIRFDYREGNRHGIGTRVLLYREGELQTRELNCSRGFQSSVEPLLHFGLGQAETVDSLIVVWPDQRYRVLQETAADQTLVISYDGEGPLFNWSRFAPSGEHWFTPADSTGINIAAHRENSFEDKLRERLIPYKISAEGPALVVGDMNGDGLEDVFLGGAKFEAARLFIQSAEGFVPREVPDFISDAITEDVDAELCDLDGDGDRDLFVVSGGGEFYGRMKPLADRVYLNDGEGYYSRSHEALPEYYENGSVVRMADFDGDGDWDAFVGGRSVSYRFGEIPRSFLLENDGRGVFSISEQPDLDSIGMVSCAAWDDFTGDGNPDLILAGEWMSPRFLVNREGNFKDVSADYLGPGLEGLWRCLEPADVDRDGDTDYLLGNWGLNTKFHASTAYPMRMYVDDFDGNGRPESLLALEQDGQYYLIHSRDELALQLGEQVLFRYPAYSDYAGKTLEEVVGQEALSRASLLQVSTLASGYLENRGGSFVFVPLDKRFQVAPLNCFLQYDFNGDSYPDILSGANFRGGGSGFGLLVSNPGIILSGDGRIVEGPECGIDFSRKEIRKTAVITVGNEACLLAAPNNDSLMWYRITAQRP